MNSYLVQIERYDHDKIIPYGIIEHEFKYLDRLIHFKSNLPIDELARLDFIINIESDSIGTFY